MENTFIRLNSKYKLVNRRNMNILIDTENNKEEMFLSPSAVILMNLLQNNISLEKTITCLSQIYDAEHSTIKNKVLSFVEKAGKYLEGSEDFADSKDNNLNIQLDIICLESNRYPYGAIKRSVVPEKIVFNITDYCPRECIYCFNGAKCARYNEIKDEFLSLSRFEEIMSEAKKIGIRKIEIGGGDPFVRKDILEYLSITDKYFPNAWATSTKAYISPEVADQLSKLHAADIQVSLDSLDSNTADKLMGVKGSYEQVRSSIKHLFDAGILPSIKMVITSLNCDEIEKNFYSFYEMGFRTIRANSYMMSPNRHSDYLYPSDEQLNSFNSKVDRMLEFARENNIVTDINKIKIPEPVTQGYDRRVLCGGSSTDMYVRHDGSMIFCGQINNCEELVIGSLKTHTVMDLWQSKKINDLFNPYKNREKYRGTRCYDCSQYESCYPKRCYVRSFTENNNFFDFDPECINGIRGYINRG